MKKVRFLSIIFLTLALATAGWAQIHLYGTGNPAVDVGAVQSAVGNPNTRVYLHGTFDFGTDGSVLIDVPNVTLQGAASGATIKGGTNPITTDDGSLPSGAKNVTIRDIHFEGWSGVAIYHAGVQDETNFTLIEGNTFKNTAHPEWLGAGGIEYSAGGGSAEFKHNTFIDISFLGLSVHTLALHRKDHILISGNTFTNGTLNAIEVDLWDPWAGDLENGPVIIRNNQIHLNGELAAGIGLGFWSFEGTSDVVAEGNVITGYGDAGIVAFVYGHNRWIINNDLSGLTTVEANIFVSGRGDRVANNVMGTTEPDTCAGLYGVAFPATGIWLCSANPSAWGLPLPDSLAVTNNLLAGNDFRRMGLKGWAYDAAGNIISVGCVLLLSWADAFIPPWPGADVTDNLIMEIGRFPRGTGGPKQQVLEFPVYAHDNRIVGHAGHGCDYAQLEAANPGIGQKIKESMAKSRLMMLNRRALLRQKHNK